MASEGLPLLTHDHAWRCDHSMVGPSPATHSCTSTTISKVNILQYSAGLMYGYDIASHLSENNSTHNQTQTNQPISEPYHVLLLSIFIGQHKKYGPLGGSQSREIGIFKLLLRSCPEFFCVCVLLIIRNEDIYQVFCSRWAGAILFQHIFYR